jgi:predicted membrane chloride channel (bestrophin family)
MRSGPSLTRRLRRIGEHLRDNRTLLHRLNSLISRTTGEEIKVKTLQQQIASAESKLARLRTKKKASDTRVKIVVGAVVAKAALESPQAAAKLAALLRERVTRDLDVKELQPLLSDLDQKAAQND